MKNTFILILFITVNTFGQITYRQAQDSVQKYHLGFSTYFEPFNEKASYGAGVIQTRDGGGAAFGDGDNGLEIIKLDKTGKVQWRKAIKKAFEEVEPQCVAQDTLGNFYVFMLNYNPNGYRGGSERVVCFSSKGTLLWDKMLGPYTLMNNPVVSYVRARSGGRIEMRGHIVKDKPVEGKDPVYRYWQGWYTSKGILTTKTGDVLDWSKPEWQNKFKPN